MVEKAEVIVNCDCGCSKLGITWADDVVFLSHYRSTFSSEQDSMWKRFTRYVRSVWKAVFCQDFFLYELVLNSEDVRKLKDALTRL